MKNISHAEKVRHTPIILLSLKRNILPFLFCLFPIFLIIFSKSNLSAAKSGLLLWANNIVPSLFPFFIATELLSYTSVIQNLGKKLNGIMRPIFNVPGIGSYALIMGIISGYPIGAKIVSNFKEEGLCTKEEAERMIAFTNNSGPLFIVATVGISLFGNTLIGILLLVTHILSSISVGIIFRFWKNNKSSQINDKYSYNFKTKKQVCFSNLGEVLSKSILSAINTIFIIGGFVVLFSVILSILKNSHFIDIFSKTFQPIFSLFGISDISFCRGFLSGIIELTNGVMQISSIPCKNISINIILCAFLLGFGGISVLLQVFSIISKSNISIRAYLIGKILHGILAALYTFIFIYTFPIFNLNL